jgi:hypothetical protein
MTKMIDNLGKWKYEGTKAVIGPSKYTLKKTSIAGGLGKDLALVPCCKRIIGTSSHVNMSDHNLRPLYGTYGCIRVNNPDCKPPTTLQQVIAGHQL